MDFSVLQDIKNKYNSLQNKKYCLYPNKRLGKCKGNIINAHSVQRAALFKIAKNKKVYSFLKRNNFMNYIANHSHLPLLININEASTFTGFCSYHDNKLFEPIEKYPFSINQQYCFLFAYRAICREFFFKKFQMEMANEYHKNSLYEKSVINGMDDAKKLKGHYDKVLLNKDYSGIKYYIIKIDQIPDILGSVAILPEYDFYGNKIQDLLTIKNADALTISIIPVNKKGAIIFSWININNKACNKFVSSLVSLKKDDILNIIVRFLFDFSENFYWSPNWWNSLSNKQRQKLVSFYNKFNIKNWSPNCWNRLLNKLMGNKNN